MKFNHPILSAFLFFGILALTYSCYPDGPEVVSDYDMLGTLFDEEYNFLESSVFIMPDTIVRIETDEDDEDFELSPKEDKQIRDYVRSSFTQNGWTDSTLNDDTTYLPDVYVTISLVATKTIGSYWSYWGWYGGWGGGYYPGYPWYPGGYPVYYQYSTGTLILDMIDTEQLFQQVDRDTIPFVWTAGMNGLLTKNSPSMDKIKGAVDKIFELSPYLIKEQ